MVYETEHKVDDTVFSRAYRERPDKIIYKQGVDDYSLYIIKLDTEYEFHLKVQSATIPMEVRDSVCIHAKDRPGDPIIILKIIVDNSL